VCPFDFIAFAPPNRGAHSFPTLCKRCTTRCNKGGGNVKESKCWNNATCHKVTVEHIHMWWCVCDVCFVFISPLTAKRKKNSGDLMSACAILFDVCGP